MKNKLFYSIIVVSVLFNVNTSFSSDKLEGTFDNIYPKPFLSTTTGKATLIVGSAIVVGAITYVSAGTGTAASAGPIATWVGTQIGSLAGYSGIAATNYGLALLGGGAASSGGLGVLGGISVLNALGDLTIAFAFESGSERINKPYKKYSMIKLEIPKHGNKDALRIIKKLNKLIKQFNKNNVDPSFFQITVNKYHNDVLNILKYIDSSSKNAGYDYLLKAVIEFNMMKYEDAKETLDVCQNYFGKQSVLFYLYSLLDLVEGDYSSAENNILMAINDEPDAIIPYILYTQILMDTERYELANRYAKAGLDEADHDNFALSLLAGNINYFNLNKYDDAIEYYENALKNITVNEFESECKLMIAKSYRKKGDQINAQEWLNSALDEVNDNENYRRTIKESWINEK